jgi:hypothetical protein
LKGHHIVQRRNEKSTSPAQKRKRFANPIRCAKRFEGHGIIRQSKKFVRRSVRAYYSWNSDVFPAVESGAEAHALQSATRNVQSQNKNPKNIRESSCRVRAFSLFKSVFRSFEQHTMCRAETKIVKRGAFPSLSFTPRYHHPRTVSERSPTMSEPEKKRLTQFASCAG